MEAKKLLDAYLEGVRFEACTPRVSQALQQISLEIQFDA